MKKLISEKYFTLGYSEEERIFFIKWHKADGNISQKDFKAMLLLFVEQVKERDAKGFYVDSTDEHVVMTPDMQEWHDTEIVPIYVSRGIKRIGFVLPSDIFAEISIQQTFEEEKAASMLQIRFFENTEDAGRWVSQA